MAQLFLAHRTKEIISHTDYSNGGRNLAWQHTVKSQVLVSHMCYIWKMGKKCVGGIPRQGVRQLWEAKVKPVPVSPVRALQNSYL